MSIKWNGMKCNKTAMQLHFNRKLLLFCSFVVFLSIRSYEKQWQQQQQPDSRHEKRSESVCLLGQVIKHLFVS